MKQLQFAYTNKYRLSEDLGSVKLWMGQTGATKVLFHIYTTNMDSKDVKEITEVIGGAKALKKKKEKAKAKRIKER